MSDFLSIIDKDKRPQVRSTSVLGERGETLAADYLFQNGFRLVLTNFRVPVGRNSKGVQVSGEIDIIALEGETLCFIEVKTRRSEDFAPVITAVDIRKQRQITRTARVYRRIFNVWDMEHRFDAVTVLMPQQTDPIVELRRNFWSEGTFRKRSWKNESWHDFT